MWKKNPVAWMDLERNQDTKANHAEFADDITLWLHSDTIKQQK
jgi:hypothetical protein